MLQRPWEAPGPTPGAAKSWIPPRAPSWEETVSEGWLRPDGDQFSVKNSLKFKIRSFASNTLNFQGNLIWGERL